MLFQITRTPEDLAHSTILTDRASADCPELQAVAEQEFEMENRS